jgi:hypothetical protein
MDYTVRTARLPASVKLQSGAEPIARLFLLPNL